MSTLYFCLSSPDDSGIMNILRCLAKTFPSSLPWYSNGVPFSFSFSNSAHEIFMHYVYTFLSQMLVYRRPKRVYVALVDSQSFNIRWLKILFPMFLHMNSL